MSHLFLVSLAINFSFDLYRPTNFPNKFDYTYLERLEATRLIGKKNSLRKQPLITLINPNTLGRNVSHLFLVSLAIISSFGLCRSTNFPKKFDYMNFNRREATCLIGNIETFTSRATPNYSN